MSSLLINDIFVLLCQELTQNNIFKFELISKFHKKIIKTNSFYNVSVYVKKNSALRHIFNKYKFKNLILNHNCDVNLYIHKLKKCFKLDLESSDILDSNILKLRKCHTLNLSHTSITNDTVKKLKHCYELILNGTDLDGEVVDELKTYCKIEFVSVDDYDYDWVDYDYHTISSDDYSYYGYAYYDLDTYYDY